MRPRSRDSFSPELFNLVAPLAEGEAAGDGKPKPLPMQILDEATGYLIAFGAVAALHRQQREGGSWQVRVSLAQTGHWLRGLGRVPGGLATQAHVFVQGYRPGGVASLGFGPAELARLRPGIVCVSLSAYGTQGPWAGRRGFDSLVQTAMGFNHAEGQAKGDDKPRALPMQILDEATGYAKTRRAFGQPIVEFQGVGFKIAEMGMRTQAARLLTHQAAWTTDHGERNTLEAAYAKAFATDTAMWAATVDKLSCQDR